MAFVPRPSLMAGLRATALPLTTTALAAAALAAAPLRAAPLAAAERLGRIPPAFRGVWMTAPRHCRARATDESWLRIEADQISFHESSGPVLAVVGRGLNEIGLITALSGEGSTWLELLRLRLENGGNRLAMEAVGLEGAAIRVRCSRR